MARIKPQQSAALAGLAGGPGPAPGPAPGPLPPAPPYPTYRRAGSVEPPGLADLGPPSKGRELRRGDWWVDCGPRVGMCGNGAC